MVLATGCGGPGQGGWWSWPGGGGPGEREGWSWPWEWWWSCPVVTSPPTPPPPPKPPPTPFRPSDLSHDAFHVSPLKVEQTNACENLTFTHYTMRVVTRQKQMSSCIFYCLQTPKQKVLFSQVSVILSMGVGWGCVSWHAPGKGVCTLASTWAGRCVSQHALDQGCVYKGCIGVWTGLSIEAGCTHPTGMHSYFSIN